MPRRLLPTGSGVERWLACQASTQLPQVETTSSLASMGRGKHRFLQVVSNYGRKTALEEVSNWGDPGLYEACENIELRGLPLSQALPSPTSGYLAEVTYTYDVLTGESRELGRGLNRDYPVANDHNIVLTVDVVGYSSDIVYVADYKTGNTVLGDVREFPQLLMGALCACTVHQVEKAYIELIYIRADGTHEKHGAEIDIFQLETFADRLRKARKKSLLAAEQIVAGGVPDVRTGSHCQWCPAYQACPAQRSLAIEVAGADTPKALQLSFSRGAMPVAYERVQAIQMLINKVRGAIITEAQREPIKLLNGKTLGQVKKKGNESLAGGVTHDVLKERHGAEVADLAIKFTATKAGIDKALKTVYSTPKEIRAEKNAVIDLVRERGGSKRKDTVSVKEY